MYKSRPPKKAEDVHKPPKYKIHYFRHVEGAEGKFENRVMYWYNNLPAYCHDNLGMGFIVRSALLIIGKLQCHMVL